MNIRRLGLIVVFFCAGFFGFKAIAPLFASAPTLQSCVSKTETIAQVFKDNSQHIVLKTVSGDQYYISQDLHEINLDTLNAKVLNKTVTLHMAKLWLGTSEYIAQLEIDDTIIFTEFN
ncbi:hypothetical protein IA57_06820 [Mangrovimonas yunxiaonensis]|uniref:Uncharacterized protein n=1 Tax=Mangrovimonas yunxiaonensis TaxID=1197477 RepID=A0A084TLF1_9FLAO|nr:hypothetical protein [Mangrovimonas yunxiaonensis]KFB01537.1 hypothetical protein IA57_06820 [Mangrovimonas yunxiaonensis]GGH36110.1 hypothetical protein GCM10011364_03130 [Mangrovimonas yunxiaonensis]